MDATKLISVLIVDDNSLLRKIHRLILNEHSRIKVVGECANGEDAVAFVKELQPNVVLMDINMPVLNGIDATKIILAAIPQCKILALSSQTEESYIIKMKENGASGYLCKQLVNKYLVKAIFNIHKQANKFTLYTDLHE